MVRGMLGRAMTTRTQFVEPDVYHSWFVNSCPHGFYFMEACDVSEEEGSNPSPSEG